MADTPEPLIIDSPVNGSEEGWRSSINNSELYSGKELGDGPKVTPVSRKVHPDYSSKTKSSRSGVEKIDTRLAGREFLGSASVRPISPQYPSSPRERSRGTQGQNNRRPQQSGSRVPNGSASPPLGSVLQTSPDRTGHSLMSASVPIETESPMIGDNRHGGDDVFSDFISSLPDDKESPARPISIPSSSPRQNQRSYERPPQRFEAQPTPRPYYQYPKPERRPPPKESPQLERPPQSERYDRDYQDHRAQDQRDLRDYQDHRAQDHRAQDHRAQDHRAQDQRDQRDYQDHRAQDQRDLRDYQDHRAQDQRDLRDYQDHRAQDQRDYQDHRAQDQRDYRDQDRKVELTQEEKVNDAKKRADYRVKFGILREAYPQMDIPEPDESQSLEEINAAYRQYVKRILVDSSVEQNKGYLLVLWLMIEMAGTKLMKLPIGGYTKSQFKYLNQYQMLLIELGEDSAEAEGGSGWPVQTRILWMAVFNGVIFVMTKLLADRIGDGMAEQLTEMINNFLTENRGEDVLRRAESATADNPPPPMPQEAEPPFGPFGDVIAQMATAFMGAGNNNSGTSSTTEQKPQVKRPTTFASRRKRNPTT